MSVSVYSMPATAPQPTPRITLIAAVAKNRVIGAGNALPWRLPEDLKRFKALTLGHPIVMGRKTWESLGRPLPGRTNIVISRAVAFTAPGANLVGSLDQALAAAAATGAEEVFVIGGADIYRQALPLAQRLQLTEIDQDFAGDVHFPAVDPALWRETARESHPAGANFAYAFVTYDHR
ncbi:MAG: dihydrofolate reductase [Proteobacteria bacterium]|nr:dihydrofolate reductase [Pseudomonadota bacterium]